MKKSIFFITLILLYSINTSAQQASDRDQMLREIDSLRSQLRARENAFLEPSNEDRAAFAEYLAAPNSGLIRLLPREDYDNDKHLTVRGGGAYYSFSRLTHDYNKEPDIEFQRGNLSVGFAGADYGMLAMIGDVPLESVTLESPNVEFLSSYAPPTLLPKVRVEQERTSRGIEAQNVLYISHVPAVVNRTYILRSITFDRSDVLVAFRILRKDTDQSLIIGWKLLKKYPLPKLERD
jgi:hypothetical protein